MPKTTKHWITTTNGVHGQVTDGEELDRWTPLGWRVAEEPKPTEFVYMRHPETGGIAPFAYGAIEPWQAMGWEFSAPPEPVDVTKDPQLFDQPKPAKTATAPAKPETTTKPAAVADKSEKE